MNPKLPIHSLSQGHENDPTKNGLFFCNLSWKMRLLSNVFSAVDGERKSLKVVLMKHSVAKLPKKVPNCNVNYWRENSNIYFFRFPRDFSGEIFNHYAKVQPRKRVSTVKGIFSSLIHAPSTFFYPSLQSLKEESRRRRDKILPSSTRSSFFFANQDIDLDFASVLLHCQAVQRSKEGWCRFAKKALQVPNLTLAKHQRDKIRGFS